MAIDYEVIGRRIKKYRRERELSQEILSELIDVSTSYISYIENARKNPSLETIVNIAQVLEITTDQLLIGEEQRGTARIEHTLTQLLADCTDYERKIIVDAVVAFKQSLQQSRDSIAKEIAKKKSQLYKSL